MEKESKISFIIVAFRSENHLERCLYSLLDKTANIQKEIIVVNNGSYSFNFGDRAKVINSSNKGFGSACNLGAKEASGDILCFLNPDTEIISADLEKIFSEFENNKIGIIGPKLVDENDNIQEWSAGKEVNLSDVILNNLGLKRSKRIWESKEEVECAWVSGACLFIKKELFEKLNGFDEKFFLYFEDIDLCKRARDLGYKVLYFPEFVVKHFGGKSFENKKEQKQHYYSSQDYYFKKHFGKNFRSIIKLLRKLEF